MESKLRVISKQWSEKKAEFAHSAIIIADENGNILMEDNDDDDANDIYGAIKTVLEPDNGTKRSEAYPNQQNEIKNDAKAVSKYENVLTREDVLVISALLDKKEPSRFTTRLKNSNYICFTDDRGLMVCRGNFNPPEKESNRPDAPDCQLQVKNKGCFWMDKPVTDTFDEAVPLLVASKVSGFVTVVAGDSSSKESMIMVVNDISARLKEIF